MARFIVSWWPGDYILMVVRRLTFMVVRRSGIIFISPHPHPLSTFPHLPGAGISAEIDVSGVIGRCELLHIG